MDTMYIKMCERAKKEIQEGWVPCAGDFYAWAGHTTRKKGTRMVGCVSYYDPKGIVHGRLGGMGDNRHKVDVLWLPRQDQLQEMVESSRLEIKHGGFINWYRWIQEHYPNDNYKNRVFTTWEQLRLGFVMHQLYQKKWNGDTWTSLI